MWPGEQPPGGGANPQQNPYQQPGYQQPNPYLGQQSAQWTASPTVTAPGPGGGGGRTKLVAVLAATTVVVAAGVTGFLVLGGGKDDQADPGPTGSPTASSASPSASSVRDNPRAGGDLKPTVSGWKVVVNPDVGIAFDVPPDWAPRSKD